MDIIDTDLTDSTGPEKNPLPEPNVTIDWCLEPTTHSYSSASSPTLKFSLINHGDRPITIYEEHIDPSTILAEGRLSIFDHTTNTDVDQIKTRYCSIAPPSKVHVPLREQLFHTLYSEVPVTFTTTFGRSKTPSRPKSIDADDGHGKKDQARGVHGLEPGHRYSLRPGKGWGFVRWWEYGEKEEVMNPPEGKLDGREVAYDHRKAPHPGFHVNVADLPVIDFWCVE
ncbi:MAG: hypothetical protein HETSPECPRED_005080 [Heterodermia speciosa]|uniref:Uncharacterized protein n=1 Tax=Heterodermia speciosa TaxID=116794 RepID=A0A8H3FAL0_9LECA|nr:MAG: hypothetical protein HETSPECPRED_005080 [Heterodermia speciosa]